MTERQKEQLIDGAIDEISTIITRGEGDLVNPLEKLLRVRNREVPREVGEAILERTNPNGQTLVGKW